MLNIQNCTIIKSAEIFGLTQVWTIALNCKEKKRTKLEKQNKTKPLTVVKRELNVKKKERKKFQN